MNRNLLIVLLLVQACSWVQANDRASREAVEALKAYAVYKMAQYEEAYARFLALAKKGNVQGMLNTANMLSEGLGVAKNETRALFWYRNAADIGDAIGMYYTGRAHELGRGVSQNTDKAQTWYRQSAEAGSTEAQLALGKLLLRQGKSEEGRNWVRQAAHSGDVVAQRYLAGLDSKDGGLRHDVPAVDRALINAAWGAIDRAARHRNAPGVVYYLKYGADVRVRLPGAAAWSQMGKQQLRDLWQETFDKAERYTLSRSEPELSALKDRINVESVIDEIIITAKGTEKLRINESASVSITDDTVVIESMTLEIERL